ncbi:MAG TPA: alpha/beta fold hydrolase [Ktedonobacterales bacterium]|nr:alpha/beta fold hydrolase [Ktedonobacterales bacterium]
MRQHEGDVPVVARRGTAPIAFEEREARVLGYRMRYLTGGTGEPVLLLHGLADCKESWQRLLPALARRHRVYAPDMLGCGASEKPPITYSLWAMAAYMRHFLDAVGIESANIVGHSLGGGLALHLYIQYPERVRRLALLASGGLGRHLPLSLRLCTLIGSSPVIGALLASRHTQHPAARLGHTLLGRLWPATALADTAETFGGSALIADQARAAAEESDILERLRDPATRAAFLRMLRDVGDIRGQRTNALEVLDTIGVPVLLIHGAQDTVIPLAHGEAARARLRDGRLEVLEDCGHCPHREAPARVSHLLESFFGA